MNEDSLGRSNNNNLYSYLALILLGILAVFPFVGSRNGDFIEDDRVIIRDNQEIREWQNIPNLFTQTYWHTAARGGLYRPLTLTSFAVDKVLWGGDTFPSPRGVHTTNILLHLLCTCLVFFLLSRWKVPTSIAFGTALLFAVHPVHNEAVVQMVGRADLLMSLFALLALYFGSARSLGAIGASGFFTLCSMLSKEMGVMVPLLLLLSLFLIRRSTKQHLRYTLLVQGLALCIYFTARGFVLGQYHDPPQLFALHVPGQFVAFINPQPYEVLFTMAHALVVYLSLSFGVQPLSADYSGFPHSTAFDGNTGIAISLLVVSLAVCLWLFSRGKKMPLFWLLWFLLLLVPVSNLFVVSGIIVAERVLYLPVLAVCAIVSFLIFQFSFRPYAQYIFLAGLVVYSSYIHITRAETWQSSGKYYEAAVTGPFAGTVAFNGMARSYLEDPKSTEAQLQKALKYVKRSMDKATTTTNLRTAAELHERLGELRESLKYWSTLHKLKPAREDYYKGTQRVLRALFEQYSSSHQFELAQKVRAMGEAIAVDTQHPEDQHFWSQLAKSKIGQLGENPSE